MDWIGDMLVFWKVKDCYALMICWLCGGDVSRCVSDAFELCLNIVLRYSKVAKTYLLQPSYMQLFHPDSHGDIHFYDLCAKTFKKHQTAFEHFLYFGVGG